MGELLSGHPEAADLQAEGSHSWALVHAAPDAGKAFAAEASAWAATANMTALAVVVSRTRVTVWVSGLRLARATGPGSSISGPARSGRVRPCRVRSWRRLSIVSARSSWSQAAAKFPPTGPT